MTIENDEGLIDRLMRVYNLPDESRSSLELMDETESTFLEPGVHEAYVERLANALSKMNPKHD